MKKPLILCLADCLKERAYTALRSSRCATSTDVAMESITRATLLIDLAGACQDAHAMHEDPEADKEDARGTFVKSAFAYLNTIADESVCSDRSCLRCRIADAASEVENRITYPMKEAPKQHSSDSPPKQS